MLLADGDLDDAHTTEAIDPPRHGLVAGGVAMAQLPMLAMPEGVDPPISCQGEGMHGVRRDGDNALEDDQRRYGRW